MEGARAEESPGAGSLAGGFVRTGFLLFLLVLLSNVVGYLFQIAAARELGPADFGRLSAVLALSAVGERTAYAFQMNVAQGVAARKGGASRAVQQFVVVAFTRALFASALAGALLASVAPLFARYLEVPLPMIALGILAIVLSPPAAVLTGLLQGRERYFAAESAALMGAIARLGVGASLIAAGSGLAGGVFANALRPVVVLAFAWLIARWRYERAASGDGSSFERNSIAVASALLAFAVLTNADVMIVKATFPAAEAGLYAGAAVIGKLVFLVAATIGLVLLPRTAAAHATSKPTLGLLGAALLVNAVATLALAGAALLMGERALATILGASFAAGAPLLAPFALATGALGSAYVVLQHLVGVGRARWSFAILAFAAVEVGLILAFHPSLLVVIAEIGAVGLAATLAGSWAALRSARAPRPSGRPAADGDEIRP